MTCLQCGCKETNQYCAGDAYASADDDRQRCAACGHIFYPDDALFDEDDEPERCPNTGELFGGES
jgi:hypothetical protein